MKKIIILSLAAMVFAACEKKNVLFSDVSYTSTEVSFKTDEMVVDVTPDTQSVDIELEYVGDKHIGEYKYSVIWLSPNESTAYPGIHYRGNVKIYFWNKTDDNPVYTIPIFPDNIKSEVILTYTIYPDESINYDSCSGIDYVKMESRAGVSEPGLDDRIDKITIRLRPKQ